MSQSYNSQYYIDIFKWLLERKFKKSLKKKPSFILNNSGTTSHPIFPTNKRSRRSQSFKYLQPNSEVSENFKNKLIGVEIIQQELINSRKNKAQLYNENLHKKVFSIKKKKENEFSEKKKLIETRQKSKEERFAIILQQSERNLSEKIRINCQKMEKNRERVLINKMKNDALLEMNLQEITKFEDYSK